LNVIAARNSALTEQDLKAILETTNTHADNQEVLGFREWVAYTAHLDAAQKQDHLNELREALRQYAKGLRGIDLRETPIAGSAQTADLTIGNTQIEVKTIREPIGRKNDLNGQLTTGLAKFNGAATAGNFYELVIYASISAELIQGTDKVSKGITTNVNANPNTLVITTTKSRIVNSALQILNTFDDDLKVYLKDRLENGNIPGAAEVAKVTVIMENARTMEADKQGNGTWTVNIL